MLGALALAPLITIAAPDKIVTPSPAAIAPQPADDAPLAFPPLEHYEKLWTGSMFTTKSLPPPDDAPKGPIFTDNLTLAGIYEVDGGVVGVLLDKTTSQVMEVRIGAENEAGIKIVRVNPGGAPDKARLQLQKGDQAGWVTFATEAAPPPDNTAPSPGGVQSPNGIQAGSPAIPGRPTIPQAGIIPGGGANAQLTNPLLPGNPIQPARPAASMPRSIPGAIPGGPGARPAAAAPNSVVPSSPGAAPTAAPASDDIPLPPQ